MRQRSFIVVAIAVALLVVGAVGVYAYDKTRADLIANGVTAGGVDLSGLPRDQARQKLANELATPLDRPLVVHYAGRDYKLSARRAGVKVDVDAMADDALDQSRKGSVVTRALRSITGGSVHAAVPVKVSYSQRVVKHWSAKVKRKIDQAPRDADIDASAGQIIKVDSRDGRTVDAEALEREIGTELTQATADHKVKVPVQSVKAKVTTAELAKQYPRVITVNRSAFRLTLYRDLKPVKTYRIAVGMAGLETPAGRYAIQDKQVDPSWHVPNSAWAGDLAGRVIPPGPSNPIKARWMGIAGGAGIHGTTDIGSLGSAASHGCIRMAIPDVEGLFDQVEVGDAVFIA
jgi:lipoprotein-anchoring transpeptidase ErfK/SrfK